MSATAGYSTHQRLEHSCYQSSWLTDSAVELCSADPVWVQLRLSPALQLPGLVRFSATAFVRWRNAFGALAKLTAAFVRV